MILCSGLIGDLSTLRSDLPLQFHDTHGDNISLSHNKTRARRAESFCKGICFSSRPIAINEKVRKTIPLIPNPLLSVKWWGKTIPLFPDSMLSMKRWEKNYLLFQPIAICINEMVRGKIYIKIWLIQTAPYHIKTLKKKLSMKIKKLTFQKMRIHWLLW